MSSSQIASSTYQPRMAFARMADSVASCENSAPVTFFKGLALLVGGVTILPVVVDYATTKLAEHRGSPIFPSGCCVRGRDVRPLSGPGETKNRAKDSLRLSPSKEIHLPSFHPGSATELTSLLRVGLKSQASSTLLIQFINEGKFAQISPLLTPDSPQAILVDALLAVTTKVTAGQLESVVVAPESQTQVGCAHQITEVQSGSKRAGVLIGSTFPHGPGASVRCQDGVYLSRYATVVTDGQGGHSADDYGHLRAMQSSVGLLTTSMMDRIGEMSEPIDFLKKNGPTLVKLINAATYAFKPDHSYGESGVEFTAVAHYGAKGAFAIGVGECTAAVDSKAVEDSGQLVEFTPKQSLEAVERKSGSKLAGKSPIQSVVGIKSFEESVVQSVDLGRGVTRVFVMSDGVRSLLRFSSEDSKRSQPPGGQLSVGGVDDEADQRAALSWGVLLHAKPAKATNLIADELRQRSEASGWNYTDLLVSDFRKESSENEEALQKYNGICNKAESESKAKPSAVHGDERVTDLEKEAAALVMRAKCRDSVASLQKAEQSKAKAEELVQATWSGIQWTALAALARDTELTPETIDSRVRTLGGFSTEHRGEPASAVELAKEYVQMMRGYMASERAIQAVKRAAGLRDDVEQQVRSEVQRELATYLDDRPPDFLKGRDDVAFVARDVG